MCAVRSLSRSLVKVLFVIQTSALMVTGTFKRFQGFQPESSIEFYFFPQ